VYLHNTTPSTRSRGHAAPIPVMAAYTGKRNSAGEQIIQYARYTCSDQYHDAARQHCYSNLIQGTVTRPLPMHSMVEFDPNLHNTCSNLSFDDATSGDTTSMGTSNLSFDDVTDNGATLGGSSEDDDSSP